MSALATTPVLRLASGKYAGQVYELRSTFRIGRHPFNEVSLPDLSVSRYHCWFAAEDGRTIVEDLASANGTFVNGERLRERRSLKAGDRLRIGATEFVFSEED